MSVAVLVLAVALTEPPAPDTADLQRLGVDVWALDAAPNEQRAAAAAVAASYRLSAIDDDPGTFTILVENDVVFALDRHYSSGVDGIYTVSRAGTPDFMHAMGRWFAPDGEVHATFGGGHNIYTPRSIILRHLDARDRPFAAFLYARAGVQTITPKHFDDLTLTLGVIGPVAGGEQVQKAMHVAIGPTPARWDSQLANEPAAMLSYQHVWRFPLGMFTQLTTEIFPHIGAAVGNVYTYGALGFTIRFGDHMPLDYGPERVLPAIQGSGAFTQTSDFGWYYFIGGEIRSVARNIFLDGNSWHDSRRVPSNQFVGDLQFGWALCWRKTRVSITHVLRSKEFERQAKPDFFGSLDLSFHI